MSLRQVQRSRCACLLAALYKPQSSSSGSSAAPPPALPPPAVLEAVLLAACHPTVTVSAAAARSTPNGGGASAAGRAATLRALLDLLGEPDKKRLRAVAGDSPSLKPGAAAKLACLVTSSCGSDEAVTELALRALLAIIEPPTSAEEGADDGAMRLHVAAARNELAGQPGLVSRLLQLCCHPEQCSVQHIGGGSGRVRLAASSRTTTTMYGRQRGGGSSSDGGSLGGSIGGGGGSASLSRSPGTATFSSSTAASTTSRRRRRQVSGDYFESLNVETSRLL